MSDTKSQDALFEGLAYVKADVIRLQFEVRGYFRDNMPDDALDLLDMLDELRANLLERSSVAIPTATAIILDVQLHEISGWMKAGDRAAGWIEAETRDIYAQKSC